MSRSGNGGGCGCLLLLLLAAGLAAGWLGTLVFVGLSVGIVLLIAKAVAGD